MPRTSTFPLAEPSVRRRITDAVGLLTTPFLPDDYLTVVNPLWSFRELRGRVEEVRRQTSNASTIVIRPGREWPGHRPGQHLAVGVDVDGRRHWRSYSLTSDPEREDGCVSITVKRVDDGTVSRHFVDTVKEGDLIRLGPAEGEFLLTEPLPAKMLFLTAGSGITPVMSMLRHLARHGGLQDAVHVHSARDENDVIFGRQLRKVDTQLPGLRVHERHSGADGRLTMDDLVEIVPDYREREVWACGPGGLLDAIEDHWEAEGISAHLHLERFELKTSDADVENTGGTATLTKSGTEAEVAEGQSILDAGEAAGALMPSGCRMGICHTCVVPLTSGTVVNLQTGETIEGEGQEIQTCICTAAGDVELTV